MCRKCAEMRQLISSADKPNLPMVVKKFVGNVGFMTAELAKLRCPDCGIKYMDFRKTGRLGCPYDYICFQAELEPPIVNIHGETEHTGKVSARFPEGTESRTQLIRLRREMKEAIDEEDYELASKLRDDIRGIEEPPKKM